MATLPSSSWYCSMMATKAREVATAVELRVWTMGWLGWPADCIGCSNGWPDSRCSWSKRRFLCTGCARNPGFQIVFFGRNRAHVTGANVDHFVVNAEAVPQIRTVLQQFFVERPRVFRLGDDDLFNLGELVHAPSPRSLWPWLPTSRRKHWETPTMRMGIWSSGMVSSMYIAVSGCSEVAIM